MFSMTRATAITLRYFYLMRSSVTRVLPLFIWIVIDIVLWGFITRYLNHVSGAGLNFVPVLLGAVLLWDFLVRVMQGVTMTFFEDVWSRNFLNIFASPISVGEYLSGMILCSVLTSSFGLAVMLLLASSVFGLSFLAYGVLLVPYLFILFLFGITLGVIGCGVVLRFGPSSEWFVWPIPALISPFVGVFYPLSTLPGWMQAIAASLPPSYVFEGVRAIAAGQGAGMRILLPALALAFLYLFLACFWFARVYRYAIRTGLVARYSAENTG